MKGNVKLICILVLLVAGFLLLRRCGSKEHLVPITQEVTENPGFLPSHQGPWFQNLPPSTTMENDYHAAMSQDCKGNYADLVCRQKAYIKAVKAGSTDLKDLLCWRFRPGAPGGSEDLYYKCLDGVYGNYTWMNRFTGTDPCLCANGEFPGQGQGAYAEDGSCYCPNMRPMKQRWPLDQDGNVVSRITQGNYL